MFIDSHCHLGFKELGSHTSETGQFLLNAKNNGVELILDIATDVKDFGKYINFSNSHDMVYSAIGIHPLHLKDNLNFTSNDIIKYLCEPKVIAIGETGLDYHYAKDEKALQKKFFTTHAEICSEHKLPIIVHTRDAWEDSIDMLTEFSKMGVTGVIHCFSGDVALAKRFLDIGFYISLSGIVTFKKSIDLHEVAKYLPKDRILTETDAPYLAPVPYRGKTNYPSYVRHTAEFISELRGQLVSDFAFDVKSNFYNLFSKANQKQEDR